MKTPATVLLFWLVGLQAVGWSQAERLVERAKRATALVDLGADGSGSGFCFNGNGLFLTNQHVVASRKIGDSVRVVLNAGEKTEKAIEGRILAWDEKEDLAVIQLKLPRSVAPLPFGNPSLLRETDKVMALGFPFGRMMTTDGARYPAMSVNIGQVTALRTDGGQLVAIQCDAAINPGNSGGPLLNSRGEVVGIIVAANPAARISIAIAGQVIRSFLQKPAILVTVPPVPYGARGQDSRIEVEAFEFFPNTGPDEVEVKLFGDGEAAPRRIRLENGKASLRTSLIGRSTDRLRLQLQEVHGSTVRKVELDDRQFKVGDLELKLSEVASIEPRDALQIVTTTMGRKYAGVVSGLNDLKWEDGAALDLIKGRRLDVYGIGKIDSSVKLEVVARRKGKEVVSHSEDVRFVGAPRAVPSHPSHPADPYAPQITDLTVELAIDGRDDILLTAGGLILRHYSFHKPGLRDDKGRYVIVNGQRWDLKWHKTSADSEDADESLIYPLNVGFDDWKLEVLSVKLSDGKEDLGRLNKNVVQEPWGVRVELDDTAGGAAVVKVRLTRSHSK